MEEEQKEQGQDKTIDLSKFEYSEEPLEELKSEQPRSLKKNKKKIRNILIIIINFLLMFMILSYYFSSNKKVSEDENIIPAEAIDEFEF